MHGRIAVLSLLLSFPALGLGPPVSPAQPSATALADAIRAFAVHSLPDPLYQTNKNWDHTKPTTTGLKWTGKGLQSKVRIARSPRKDGTWRKIRITAINPAQGLRVEVRNLRQPEPGHMTFDVWAALPTRLEYQQQNWKAGVKLFDDSAQARMQLEVAVNCEVTTKLEWKGKFLPEAVFQLRVAKANVSHSHLVVEHVAGLGGEAAKLLGDVMQDAFRQWLPSLEKRLLGRADAAIEKAGNTREIRISLNNLLSPRN
jgi:hypothetical protein